MMKIKITLFLITIAGITVTTLTSMNNNSGGCDPSPLRSTGAPAGYCGDPAGGGLTCHACHSDGPAPTTLGSIASNIPGSGYVANTTYTITATITRAGHTKFGFEISPQNASGTTLGTLINTSTQTQLVGTSFNYITHTSTGTTGTSGFHTWAFNWTAPTTGSGPVTFYGAFNVTNANGFNTGDTIYTQTATIQENVPLTVTVSATNVTCNGQCNGSATATASGGTSPYTYLWSNAKTTSAITGLCAGSYTVTVSDASAATKTATVSITQPSAISVTPTQTNVSCNGGNNGNATATVSGGTSPYSYSWSNGQTTSTAINLSATNYTVTVTDVNSCTKTATISITQPSALTTTISAQTNVSCNGGNNGSAAVTAGGGTPAYTYVWSNGQSTSAATNLSAGNYTVTVSDANSCTKTASVTITQPTSISISVSTTNAGCGQSNGTATATPSGGTPGYTYLWNNAQTNATATGLVAGTYTITVTDTKGCTKAIAANVSNSGGPTISPSSTQVSCNGGNNGTATVNPSGGNPPYTYSWSTSPIQTTQTATGLSAGSYNITVTDANGCISNTAITITQPSVISITTAQTNVSCNGVCNGSATATPSGGTPSYTYSWLPSGPTTQTISNICAGTYAAIVTDANGCTATKTLTITQPTAITASMSVTNASSCTASDGSVTANTSGGTTPYTYSWNNGGSTSAITGLAQGTYTLNITDGNGCTYSAIATVSCPNGVIQLSEQNGFSVYPNPTSGVFVITSEAKQLQIEIFNLLGIKIFSISTSGGGTGRGLTINLSDKPNGIYLIQLKSENGIGARKIIKE